MANLALANLALAHLALANLALANVALAKFVSANLLFANLVSGFWVWGTCKEAGGTELGGHGGTGGHHRSHKDLRLRGVRAELGEPRGAA